MNSWTRFLQLGCVQYASYPGVASRELLEVVKRLAMDPMFEVIELTRISEPTRRQEIRRILDSAELTVVFSGGPVYLAERIELGALDGLVRMRSLEKAKRLVDEAIELGARFHLVASGPDPGPEARLAARSFLVDSLVELCAYASATSPLPLIVTLEPFDREVAHRALIGPTEEAVSVAQEVRKRIHNFALTLDLSHLIQLGEDPPASVRRAAGVIAHVHLGSCYLADSSHPAYGDQHVRFGFTGGAVGEAMVASFLQALYNHEVFARGRVPVSLEVKPQPGEDPDVVLSAAKRSFLRAWRLAEEREIDWKSNNWSGRDHPR